MPRHGASELLDECFPGSDTLARGDPKRKEKAATQRLFVVWCALEEPTLARTLPAKGMGALVDQSQLIELAVEQTRDYALLVLDPAGNVLTWNTGAANIKGYRPEEILGRHFSVSTLTIR